MTPEQKQRIEQIERWSRTTRDMEETAIKNRISPGESENENKLRDDIDFLLSLVKSQEATPSKSVVRRLAQQGAICRECLYSPTLDLVRLCQRHAAIDDAATSMRSACVEELKRLARERVGQSKPNHKDHEYDQAVAFVLLQAAEKLESLSIEKQK